MKDSSVSSRTIEWLRFFCVVLVVFVHAFGKPLQGLERVVWQNGFYDTVRISVSEGICVVAVPIFFFISGFLFFRGLEEWNTSVWIGKLKKRVRTLLVPYLIWNILSILVQFLSENRAALLWGAFPDIGAWFQGIGGWRVFWGTGSLGLPHNAPLWFIRNLMLLAIFAPLIFLLVRKSGVVGLLALTVLYVPDWWIKVPGFEISGLLFFAAGALFTIRRMDFSESFEKVRIPLALVSIPFWVVMVLSFGNDYRLFGIMHRCFALFACPSVVGTAAHLIRSNRIRERELLSGSVFMVFAMHATIVLPRIVIYLNRIFPSSSQAALILKYFAAPLLTVLAILACYSLMRKWTPRTLAVLTGGRA
ncbi:MAG: acyltransferase family protein [Lachnospiraceae bacterium]|nr:acyltransferase family protein [Bacteroidales bacterium]MBQ7556522.1 acyltransferase family protein [Lachnospiraceae bacterium]